MQKNYTGLGEYFKKIISVAGPLRANDYIYAMFPDHISQVIKLINSTSKRVLANYIMWKIFNDDELRDMTTPLTIFKTYRNEIDPRNTFLKSRPEACFNLVSGLHSTAALFAEKFIGKKVQQAVGTIMHAIRDEFKEALKAVCIYNE